MIFSAIPCDQRADGVTLIHADGVHGLFLQHGPRDRNLDEGNVYQHELGLWFSSAPAVFALAMNDEQAQVVQRIIRAEAGGDIGIAPSEVPVVSVEHFGWGDPN